jgi:hypothetical protein
MSDNELAQLWVDTFQSQVKELEERSNVPTFNWKTAGRKTKANPNGEDLAYWQEEGLRQVTEYSQWLNGSGWEIATMPDGKPGIEWEGIVEFGGKPVKFIIDLILKHGESLIVTDFKTGKRTPFGCEQLALYASGVEKLFDVRPRFGAFFMTRSGELGDLIELEHWGIDYFEYQFTAVNTFIDSGFFPPNVGEHCGWCSQAVHCSAVKGSKSHGFQIGKKGKEQA